MTAHRRNGSVTVDELAQRAADGDRVALSALVRELQHPMYRLALRFLGDPDDAQDACQEILVLLCLSRQHRAAYLLADVIGLTDVEGAEILECTREAFRQRVARARRTLRQIIDNRCGLVDPANPCRCGRQIAASETAGILRRHHLALATHPREEVRVWIEPVARQLDEITAIGDLYRFDRFAAPASLRSDLQQRYPDLLGVD